MRIEQQVLMTLLSSPPLSRKDARLCHNMDHLSQRLFQIPVFSLSGKTYSFTGPILVFRTEWNHRVILFSLHPNGSCLLFVDPGKGSKVMVSACFIRRRRESKKKKQGKTSTWITRQVCKEWEVKGCHSNGTSSSSGNRLFLSQVNEIRDRRELETETGSRTWRGRK